MRRSFVAGNWKMHGTVASSLDLLQAIVGGEKLVGDIELAVFPPYLYLSQCAAQLSGSAISFGAQNVSEHPNGAYTGEISANMLHDIGCRYVIVGHSERRGLYGENNKLVAKKCEAALNADLIPIVCVGETAKEREKALTLKVVQEQLAVVLLLADNCPGFSQIVIAYEPVWAIGTGQSATPEQAQEVHAAIREQLRRVRDELANTVRVLYGGSVNPSNAKALFAKPDIDGALVGGASLDAQKFIEIGQICNN